MSLARKPENIESILGSKSKYRSHSSRVLSSKCPSWIHKAFIFKPGVRLIKVVRIILLKLFLSRQVIKRRHKPLILKPSYTFGTHAISKAI